MVSGCHEKTAVVFVIADKGGHLHKCAPSMVIDRHSKQNSIRAGWSFVGWYARCSGCYLRELDATGKSRFGTIESEVEAHREYMARQSEDRARAILVRADEERSLLEAAQKQYGAMG